MQLCQDYNQIYNIKLKSYLLKSFNIDFLDI